jgi:hypothetical protein
LAIDISKPLRFENARRLEPVFLIVIDHEDPGRAPVLVDFVFRLMLPKRPLHLGECSLALGYPFQRHLTEGTHATLNRDALERLPALTGFHCGQKTRPRDHDFVHRNSTLISGESALITPHGPHHRFDLMLVGKALLFGGQLSADRLGAVRADFPQEALSDRPPQGGGDRAEGESNGGHSPYGAHRVVRVYGGEHEVARHGRV